MLNADAVTFFLELVKKINTSTTKSRRVTIAPAFLKVMKLLMCTSPLETKR